MIKEVDGNLLTYPGLQVIGHQTNCLGVMGAGIAKQIKANNPELFKSYVRYCKRYPDAHNILGTVYFCAADHSDQIIANMFSQYSFSETTAPFKENGKPRHTDYEAFKECLNRIHTWMVLNDKTSIGVPDHIGCGLAGGNWDTVKRLIYYEFEDDDDITLYIVKYNG